MSDVTFLAPDTDAFVDSVVRHVSEYEDRTGTSVELRIIPSDDYFSNDIRSFLVDDRPIDVFMSGPVLLWQHIGDGLVEPLDQYVASADSNYEPDDFLPSLLRVNRWSGRFGDPLGEGPLMEIPVNCESYNLAYVPETLARFGIDVPSTWEEYFEAARRIVRSSDGTIQGFGQRGLDVWHTMYTGYASQFWSYGATDFGPDGRCAIASVEGIAATEAFLTALRDAGPRNWLDQRWYELALDFAKGEYGLIVDSDHYVAFFEDRQTSDLAGRIAYSPPPVGPTGLSRPNLWTWSMVMNARSTRKAEAWRFMEWATGPAFLRRSASEGNMNPTRTSTWDDARFIEQAAGWADFYGVARRLAEDAGDVLVTPASDYLLIAARWVRALREAFAGQTSVEEALADAARDIDEIVAG